MRSNRKQEDGSKKPEAREAKPDEINRKELCKEKKMNLNVNKRNKNNKRN